MKHSVLPILSVICILSCPASGCSQAPIIIGYSARITGVGSDIGVDGRNGAAFAVETINSRGGMAGRELRLISIDDGTSPEEAAAADRELVKNGAVAIIGHITSTKTLAALPFLEEEGIPMVAPVASSPKLEGAGSILYRMNSSSSRSARAMATYAKDELGCAVIIPVLDQDNEIFGSSFSGDFGSEFSRKGGIYLEPVWFSSRNLVDWGGTVEAVSATDATGILILASPADAASFANAVAGEYCLFSSGWAYTDTLLRFGGKAVENMIFADTFTEALSGDPKYSAFEEAYLRRFGKNPSFASIQAYDAVLFIAGGLEMAEERDLHLREALGAIRKFQGAYCEIELTETGEALRPVFISSITDGAFITVKEIPIKSGMEDR
jgi:branched-chain amino acid transport system substrate-binding protein